MPDTTNADEQVATPERTGLLADPPAAPGGPQLGPRPGEEGPGLHPLVVIGIAFVLGILLAKLLDRRGRVRSR